MAPVRSAIGVCASVLLCYLGATAAVAASTAATTPTVAPPAQPTSASRFAGALEHPDRLKLIGDDKTLRWTNPGVDFHQFDRIFIERVGVKSDSYSAPIDPKDSKALTDYLRQSLVKALSAPYRVVETTGNGVLRVRITIVDVVATKPETDAEPSTPNATAPSVISAPIGGGAPYLGHSVIAAQFIDGATNTLVAEYAEARFGRKYIIDPNRTALGPSYVESLSTWDYAKQAFDAWSQQFRKRLDELRNR